jgi:hypothetical protein
MPVLAGRSIRRRHFAKTAPKVQYPRHPTRDQPAFRRAGTYRLNADERQIYDAFLAACDTFTMDDARAVAGGATVSDWGLRFAAALMVIQEPLLEASIRGGEGGWDDAAAVLAKHPDPNAEIRIVSKAEEVLVRPVGPRGRGGRRLGFSRTDPAYTRYAQERGAELVTYVSDTSRGAIKRAVSDAFTNQVTWQGTARRITDILSVTDAAASASIQAYATRGLTDAWGAAVNSRFTETMQNALNSGVNAERAFDKAGKAAVRYGDKLRRARGRAIARTEIMRASNYGRRTAMDQMARQGLFNPQTAGKRWVAASFDVCNVCSSENDRGMPVPYNGSFDFAGVDYPPAHTNCRCSWVLVPNWVPVDAHGRPVSRGPEVSPDGRNVTPENFTDTKQAHTVTRGDGSLGYSSGRLRAVHTPFIDGTLAEGIPVAQAEQTVTFLGGGPATGKSSLLRSGKVKKPRGTITANADDAKEAIPEFRGQATAGNKQAAAFVHEESSDLMKTVLDDAIDSRFNVHVDGTGDKSWESMAAKVERAATRGMPEGQRRRVVGEYVTLDVDEALRRSELRYAKPFSEGGGRAVPEQVLRDTHESVSRIFPELADVDLMDELRLWDNDVPFGSDPILVFEKIKGQPPRILDAQRYEKFLSKNPDYTPGPIRPVDTVVPKFDTKFFTGEKMTLGFDDTEAAFTYLIPTGQVDEVGEQIMRRVWYGDRVRDVHDPFVADGMATGMVRPAGEVPRTTIMGGGPASGKSSVIREVGEEGAEAAAKPVHLREGSVIVNADDAKGVIPEYAKVSETSTEAAAFVHEESSYIAKRLYNDSLDAGYDTVLDGTGDSSYRKLKGKVEAARARGHEVVGEYVTIDTDVAMGRMVGRYERAIARGDTPRSVPPQVLRDTHAAVSRVLPEALADDLYDQIRLWDTHGKTPILILEKTRGGKLVVHRPDLYERFLLKDPSYVPGSNPHAQIAGLRSVALPTPPKPTGPAVPVPSRAPRLELKGLIDGEDLTEYLAAGYGRERTAVSLLEDFDALLDRDFTGVVTPSDRPLAAYQSRIKAMLAEEGIDPKALLRERDIFWAETIPDGFRHMGFPEVEPLMAQVQAFRRKMDDIHRRIRARLLADVEDALRVGVSDADVMVAMPSGKFTKVARSKDGRLKSQFEARTSGGTLDWAVRSEAEFGMFGYVDEALPAGTGTPGQFAPSSSAGRSGGLVKETVARIEDVEDLAEAGVRLIDATERPIYGFVGEADLYGFGGRVEQYGDVKLVLKRSRRPDVTITGGDSLSSGRDQFEAVHGYVSPLRARADDLTVRHRGHGTGDIYERAATAGDVMDRPGGYVHNIRPSAIDDLDFDAFSTDTLSDLHAALHQGITSDPKWTQVEGLASLIEHTDEKYVWRYLEAQIHGGVSLDDVAAVVISSDLTGTSALGYRTTSALVDAVERTSKYRLLKKPVASQRAGETMQEALSDLGDALNATRSGSGPVGPLTDEAIDEIIHNAAIRWGKAMKDEAGELFDESLVMFDDLLRPVLDDTADEVTRLSLPSSEEIKFPALYDEARVLRPVTLLRAESKSEWLPGAMRLRAERPTIEIRVGVDRLRNVGQNPAVTKEIAEEAAEAGIRPNNLFLEMMEASDEAIDPKVLRPRTAPVPEPVVVPEPVPVPVVEPPVVVVKPPPALAWQPLEEAIAAKEASPYVARRALTAQLRREVAVTDEAIASTGPVGPGIRELNERAGRLKRAIAEIDELDDAVAISRAEAMVDEAVDVVTPLVQQAVDEGDVIVNMDGVALRKILAEPDQRLKSQFETGTTGGTLDPVYRAEAEFGMFGYVDETVTTLRGEPVREIDRVVEAVVRAGDDEAAAGIVRITDAERPIYGFIGEADTVGMSSMGTGQYGDLSLVLKQAKRGDVTAVIGDSLAAGREATTVAGRVVSGESAPRFGTHLFRPSRLDDIDVRRFSPTEEVAVLRQVVDDAVRDGRSVIGAIDDTINTYVEAQIHGGMSLDDVAAVVVRADPTASGSVGYRTARVMIDGTYRIADDIIPAMVSETAAPAVAARIGKAMDDALVQLRKRRDLRYVDRATVIEEVLEETKDILATRLTAGGKTSATGPTAVTHVEDVAAVVERVGDEVLRPVLEASWDETVALAEQQIGYGLERGYATSGGWSESVTKLRVTNPEIDIRLGLQELDHTLKAAKDEAIQAIKEVVEEAAESGVRPSATTIRRLEQARDDGRFALDEATTARRPRVALPEPEVVVAPTPAPPPPAPRVGPATAGTPPITPGGVRPDSGGRTLLDDIEVRRSIAGRKVVTPAAERIDELVSPPTPYSTGPTRVVTAKAARIGKGNELGIFSPNKAKPKPTKPKAPTFKKGEIETAWERTGLSPDDFETTPKAVMDELQVVVRERLEIERAYGEGPLRQWMDDVAEWEATRPRSPYIEIAFDADDIGKGQFTFVHESGHRADYIEVVLDDGRITYVSRMTDALEKAAMREGGVPVPPEVQAAVDFLEAAHDTDAVKHLVATYLPDVPIDPTPEMITAIYAGRAKGFAGMADIPGVVDMTGYGKYVTEPQEIWARAYSQWVATRNGTDEMVEYLAGQTPDSIIAVGGDVKGFRMAAARGDALTDDTWVGYQWSEEEFERVIAPRVEAVLRSWGMLV